LAGRNGTISKIKRNLERCGYSDRLLQTDYVYSDNMGPHTVPLAGFAHPVYDSRTACVSVIANESLMQVSAEQVNEFRGLGAPVVLVCGNGTTELWTISREGANWQETIADDKLDGFFADRKEDFRPERLRRAKNLARVNKREQLGFVDIGLMPLLEEEMGKHLGVLMRRVIDSLEEGFTEGQLEKYENQRWIFRAAFWLLCAKILHDKRVKKFTQLNLTDVKVVFEAVADHYGAQDSVEVKTAKQRSAIETAAGKMHSFASLANLTTEALGYMYENVLVNKKLRTALGIHATPSYLVDYIVWQLCSWIEQIPENKRIVLEPACGHAPFLTGSIRLLRELFNGDETEFHKYAKKHLIGIEKDPFAREIARLSLTMADVPNPNGWKIQEGDIYCGDMLSNQARNSMILLSNPPFENFKPEEQTDYINKGQQLKCYNKAAEMLWRTLPYMREGSVFGVVLPHGFLNRDNLADLREIILRDFELQQICLLPKKVFRHANHESVVLAGRKKSSRRGVCKTRNGQLLYRHVRKDKLEEFRHRYAATDQYVSQSMFFEVPLFKLKLRELDDVWKYCERNYLKLDSISEGGQGLIYEGKDLPPETRTFEKKRFAGAVKGYALFDSDVQLHRLPTEYWMNLAPEAIRRPAWGTAMNRAQVLLNYAPVRAEPWRLKALIDRKGHPVTSRFLVFRITDQKWSLDALWAVLNAPLANAFIYAHTTDRDIPAGTARRIPIPSCSGESLERLKRMVVEYFALMEERDKPFGIDDEDKVKHLLLSIDAEVMRLYDLPPRMEKRVLDLFQGVERKGVPFSFTGYYPEGFESAMPLHEYLSEEYQRSTVSFVKKWVEDNRSPEISKVFERALEAFEQ